MSTDVLVVAPHPDDETLGCGGTLLRHAAIGDPVHWLIVTDVHVDHGYDRALVERRTEEIRRVADAFGFASVDNLGLPPARLDALARADLVKAISAVIRRLNPAVLYLPFRGDAHSDHAVVFDAAAACTKWFRQPSIRRVLCYETPSETDFGMRPGEPAFAPNTFVDVSRHLDRKLEIAALYEGEMGTFPFPRSPETIRALAAVRGAASGCQAAEGFLLLRDFIRD
jgi:LmbE family N-acetylglucosaminyl deacetylase